MQIKRLFSVVITFLILPISTFAEGNLDMNGTVKNLREIPGGEVYLKAYGVDGKASTDEKNFFKENIYPKFHPKKDDHVIGGGHWETTLEESEIDKFWGMGFKLRCADDFECVVVNNSNFAWLVSLTTKGEFLDAILVYAWDSEWVNRKNIREIKLDTYLFEYSGGLAPYEGEGAQTTDLIPLGLSDTGLLCNRFSERFMPGERQGFTETRVYRIKNDGHFELVQTGSCILSDEKISELGLTGLVKKAKDGRKRPRL